jgi:hypothetical protein
LIVRFSERSEDEEMPNMDYFTAAENLELILSVNESLDAQFQYWLSISVAGIVATFAGGEYLKLKMRFVLVFLYLLASMLFMFKFIAMLVLAGNLATLNEASQNLQTAGLAPYIFWTRTILFVGGVIATVWFMLTARQRDDT